MPSTSSPTPRSTVETTLAKVSVPKKLLDGIAVTKVSTKGKMQQRVLKLSDDRFTLFLSSSGMGGHLSMFKPMLLKVRSGSTGSSMPGSANDVMDDHNSGAIDISSIDRIQRGQSTLKFERARGRSNQTLMRTNVKNSPLMSKPTKRKQLKNCLNLNSEQSFSIVFRGARTMDLMITDQVSRDEILEALDKVVRAYNTAKRQVGNDVLLLRYIWIDVDKDKSQTLDLNEISNVMNRINFYMTKEDLSQSYKKFAKVLNLDRNNIKNGLTFDQCVTFLHKTKRDTWQVKPSNLIWDEMFGADTNLVHYKIFLKEFLHKSQGETDVTPGMVKRMFTELNQLELAHIVPDNLEGRDPKKYISKHRFEAYLWSEMNEAFDPKKEALRVDEMDYPLSYYWINSSHNTFLTGDQLKSYSSVEMYIKALYRGCRCVEIDSWDGEKDDYDHPIPIVHHGYTRTTKIPFSDVLKAIKVFINFNPDCFPIIISLENHCSIPYQEVMADHFTHILGESLYIPDDSKLQKEKGQLPSPASLIGKVIIKGKRTWSLENIETDFSDSDSDGEDGVDEEIFGEEVQSLRHILKEEKLKTKNVALAPELSYLTFFHSMAYKNWETSLAAPCHHMHSGSESKPYKLSKGSQRNECIKFNRDHMMRAYPSGSRVNSSNYNPLFAWSVGYQLVALNIQNSDSSLYINDGRFRENGACGYILKPNELRTLEDVENLPLTLTVRILGGSCLPKPKEAIKGECIDSYVKVELFDVDQEIGRELSKSYSTDVFPNNGFCPIWVHNTFQFTVKNENVAMLLLTVMDKDRGVADDFIANAAIPISCLRKGYRSVRLFDTNNTRSGAFDFASLLVHIEIEMVV